MHKIIIDSYTFPLAMLYLLVALACIFQIVRIVYYRHSVLHFQFIFLGLCLAWALLRVTFWLLLPWSSLSEIIMQGSALLLQFTLFSFLVLFYGQMIYRSEKRWRSHKAAAFSAFGFVNLLFLAAFTVNVILFNRLSGELSDVLLVSHAFFVAGMYLVLSVLLSYFGYRLMHLVGVQNVQIPFLRSKIQIAAITITIVLVFSSRAVKDFLSGLEIGTLEFGSPETQPLHLQALLFAMYFCWEIIPAALVLMLFWHIPASARDTAKAVPAPYYSINSPSSPPAHYNQLHSPPSSPYGASRSQQHFSHSITTSEEYSGSLWKSPGLAPKPAPSTLFQNPARYDSDDEVVVGKSPARPMPPAPNPRTPLRGPATPKFAKYSSFSTELPTNLTDHSDSNTQSYTPRSKRKR